MTAPDMAPTRLADDVYFQDEALRRFHQHELTVTPDHESGTFQVKSVSKPGKIHKLRARALGSRVAIGCDCEAGVHAPKDEMSPCMHAAGTAEYLSQHGVIHRDASQQWAFDGTDVPDADDF